MALSSVSDVEKVLGVDLNTTDESTVTNLFIPTADQAIDNFVGYELDYTASITEKFDGDNTEDIFLSRSPVVAITSVTEDGNTLSEGNSNDYVLYSNLGRLRRTALETWSDAKLQNITVVYSAGYSDSEGTAQDVPKDVKYISARVAARLFAASASLGTQQSTGTVGTHLSDNTSDAKFQMVKQEKIGDYSVVYESPMELFSQDLLTAEEKRALSRYKRQFFTSAGILD